MTKHNIFIILLLMLGLVSCDQNRVFDQYKSMPDGWHKDSLTEFNLPQLDSLKQYNLFLTLRNTNEYPFSNLYLITKMEFPEGKTLIDTLQYEMAQANGEWLGTGFTDLKENKLWYKEKIRFTEKGDYKITIQHAMRKNGKVYGIDLLEGVTEVGFRIENINP